MADGWIEKVPNVKRWNTQSPYTNLMYYWKLPFGNFIILHIKFNGNIVFVFVFWIYTFVMNNITSRIHDHWQRIKILTYNIMQPLDIRIRNLNITFLKIFIIHFFASIEFNCQKKRTKNKNKKQIMSIIEFQTDNSICTFMLTIRITRIRLTNIWF